MRQWNMMAVCGMVAVCAVATAGTAPQWPQWRGPLGTGIAPDGNPPVEWSETKNICWKTAIPGAGNASPIVWNDRAYILTAVETDKKPEIKEDPEDAKLAGWQKAMRTRATAVYAFTVMALDMSNGAVVWKKVVSESLPAAPRHKDASWASNTPATDGERLYAHFGSHGLYCLDLEGNVKWNRNFGAMRTKNHFGEGSSPIVSGDCVLVLWDHEDQSFITALDRKTGEEKWKTPREEKTSWATPVVATVNGRQEVLTSATGRIRSYALETGKLLWEMEGMVTNVIPTPVVQNGIGYFASGYRTMASLMAIDLARAGSAGADKTGSSVLWKFDRDTPYVPSTLVSGECVYILKLNDPVLTCLDSAGGKVLYGPEKLEALKGVYSSPVGAAGRVYITGRSGATVVLKTGGKLEVMATNPLDDAFTASAAIVGDRILLRGAKSLYCIGAVPAKP